MVCYAITADTHGHFSHLKAVVKDARRRGATAFIDLGDVGTDPCYDLLRQTGAQGAFGNYEVTRRYGLRPDNASWVGQLAPLVIGKTFLAAHATPYMPPGLHNVDDVLEYVLEHGVRWTAIFPRLDEDEDARLLTWTELQARNKRIFFHGHTHRQAVWRLEADGRARELKERTIHIEEGGWYIIGVGSVGEPLGDTRPQYALYDEERRLVTLLPPARKRGEL